MNLMSGVNEGSGGDGKSGEGRIEGHIYVHPNDPTVVRKGVNITDVRQAQGGFLPLLAYTPYNQRRHDNTSYNYNARIHHGTRPMHQSTLTLTHPNHVGIINRRDPYLTQTQSTYRGYQLKPEYIQYRGEDQFNAHFDIGENSPARSLKSSYSSEFYNKIRDKEYASSFDLMPKYSVGKQIKQLEQEGKPRVYANRDSKIGQALVHNEHEPDYWTQYNRVHGVLGSARGAGVPREYPSRASYNIFTGERLDKPSWSMNGNYKLVSRYRRDLCSSANILN